MTPSIHILDHEREETLAPSLAERIFSEFSPFMRKSHSYECLEVSCEKCSSPHLSKISEALQRGEAPIFVLPAFPGKSPNLNKVLGYLPDEAEREALRFLGRICSRVRSFYTPGIRVLICSDGRVFSDVVGMEETHVTAYKEEMKKLIKDLRLPDISTFDLDDCYPGLGYLEMREKLLSHYGPSLPELKEKVREGGVEKQMYLGITRFLFEDALTPHQSKSRAAIQREARSRAYEVIQRSNAWSELIEKIFPEAVRLSIHPQACGSKKLGIRLIGEESWITPWHGVLVKGPFGQELMKRKEAEAQGAKLFYVDGRASHYEMEQKV